MLDHRYRINLIGDNLSTVDKLSPITSDGTVDTQEPIVDILGTIPDIQGTIPDIGVHQILTNPLKKPLLNQEESSRFPVLKKSRDSAEKDWSKLLEILRNERSPLYLKQHYLTGMDCTVERHRPDLLVTLAEYAMSKIAPKASEENPGKEIS